MIRLAAAVAVIALSACAAAARPLTSGEYARAVADAAAGFDQAAASGKRDGAAAKRALASLPVQARVQSPDGAVMVVDNRRLIQALRRQVGSREGIPAAAAALRSLDHVVTARAQPAPARARDVLAQILRRREFRPGRIQVLWARIGRVLERVIEKVGRLLGRVFDALTRFAPALPRQVWRVAVIVLLAAAAGAALFLVVRLVLLMMPDRPRPVRAKAPVQAPVHPSAAWLADAEAAAGVRDYRSAIRALHMAALVRLDEAGLVRYVDSRTDGRFVTALREGGRHELAQAVAALGLVFAVAWYGLGSAGADEYAVARSHWNLLEAGTTA
ncbi:MAG TPA: DUF4129 domain-containing protein [Armatimonadota bacterium]|nr:DUF4129 domain-containing protein [Armatimonadota bacterium]